MLNEILFFLEVVLIVGFALGALRFGKGALVAWVAIQAIIANLFVMKQITLAGFNVTASDAFAIGSLLGLNLLQEYFGKEEARTAVWICFFFMIFFVCVSQIHMLFTPSSFDTTHNAFTSILSSSPRLLIASLTVFFVVQQLDILLFSSLKNFFPQQSFSFRTGISLIVSQLVDTVLFSFAGLYGIVASMVDIIFVSLAVKLIVILCFTSIVKWTRA